jgi:hypothetical protein
VRAIVLDLLGRCAVVAGHQLSGRRTVTPQPWRRNHSPTSSRSSEYHSSSLRGISRWGSTLAMTARIRSIRSRRLARTSGSQKPGPKRLHGDAAASHRELVNTVEQQILRRAGKYGVSPSADQTPGADASKPACCNAVGQS